MLIDDKIQNLSCEVNNMLFTFKTPIAVLVNGSNMILLNSLENHQWQLMTEENERTEYPHWKKDKFVSFKKVVKVKAPCQFKACWTGENKHISPRVVAFLCDSVLNDMRLGFLENLCLEKSLVSQFLDRVHSLNAISSYFRGYVPHFSARTKMIRMCSTGKRPADDLVAAHELDDIKMVLINAPSLRKPPTGSSLLVESDFLSKGLGVALFFEEGKELLLSKIISRKTTDAEAKLPAIEGEATALLWSLKEVQSEIMSGQRLNVLLF